MFLRNFVLNRTSRATTNIAPRSKKFQNTSLFLFRFTISLRVSTCKHAIPTIKYCWPLTNTRHMWSLKRLSSSNSKTELNFRRLTVWYSILVGCQKTTIYWSALLLWYHCSWILLIRFHSRRQKISSRLHVTYPSIETIPHA